MTGTCWCGSANLTPDLYHETHAAKPMGCPNPWTTLSNDHTEDDVPDLEEVNNEESAEDGSEDDDDGDDNCDDDNDPDSALDFGGADDGVNELDMLLSDEKGGYLGADVQRLWRSHQGMSFLLSSY